jgi:hypothetical protein
MPDAIRQQIVDAVKTRLGTVAGITSVHEWLTRPLEVAELPAAVVRDLASEPSPDLCWPKEERDLTVEIELYAAGATSPAAMRGLLADVTVAIGTDRQWGGLAETTTHPADEMNVDEAERKIVGAVMTMTIVYKTGSFDPYNA